MILSVSDTSIESASSEKVDSSELYSSAELPSDTDIHSKGVPSAATESETFSCNLTPRAGGSANISSVLSVTFSQVNCQPSCIASQH